MELRLHPRVQVNDAALRTLATHYGIQTLALFGSILRDDFRDGSDIDILVTFRPDSLVKSLLDLAEVVVALEDLFGRSVDLVEPHTLDPWIRDKVLASQQVIYVGS